MVGKWLEGFETHTNSSQLAQKYATFTGSITAQSGRVFGNSGGILSTVAVTPSLGLSTTYILGFGVRIASQSTALNSGAQGLYLEKSSSEQCHLEFVNNSGSFEIRIMRGSTQIAITSAAFGYAVWHHIEVLLTIDPSAGAYELRHNEVSLISGSSVNLANVGSSQADIFALRFTSNVSTVLFIDDINLKDDTGGLNDDFLGDFVIEGKLPNANGTTIQWTNDAGSGSNFQNVDDPANAAPDNTGAGGTNSSDTSGQRDLYAFEDLTQIDGQIAFIQVSAQLGMLAAGSRNVDLLYRDSGGTVTDVDTVNVASTTFDEFTVILDENPVTAAPWDVNDINNGEFGVEVV